MPLTQEELQAIVKQTTDAIAPQIKVIQDQQADIVKTQGILADTLKQLPPARTASSAKGGDDTAAAAGTPLDAAAITKLVQETITGALTQQQQQTQAAQRRSAFAGEKLKDLPQVYRDQLGHDETKWAAEEQSIRQRYQADFKAAGGTVTPVNGGAGAGGAETATAAQTVDLSKLNPVQKISLGLKNHPIPGAAQQQQQQQPQQQAAK